MPVRVYRSSDSGAPTLNGNAGSLIEVLKACLVDGYGSMPAAGWTMPFSSGTPPTIAAFRQGAKTGLPQYYLRVRDDASGAALGREAFLRAYETMSDLNTGTMEFPTTGQLASGAVVRKSHTADETARTWILAADERTFILLVYHPSGFSTTGGSRADGYTGMYFGDYVPANPNFAYRAALMARSAQNVADHDLIANMYGAAASPSPGRVVARDYSGSVASQPLNLVIGGIGTQFGAGSSDADEALIAGGQPANSRGTLLSGANAADGRLWMSPIYIYHKSPNTVLGYLRGLWAPMCLWSDFPDRTTIPGTGAYAGRTFQFVTPVRYRDGSITRSNLWHGALCLETSDTWDS